MIKINKENLTALYKKISEKYPLYLPVKVAGEVNYGYYQEGSEVSLDTLRTVKSPKDIFFPQSEDLVEFKVDGKKIEVIDIRKENLPFVVMGVRACDYRAFDVLDRVFLADPVDTYYRSRREAGIVITSACSRPDESCFCSVFGIDATNPLGDITVWQDSDYLYWRSNTDKGADLTAYVSDLFVDSDSVAVEEQRKATKEIIKKLPFASLELDKFDDKLLDLFYDEKWAKLSEACLGCGTCTFVCPTCQCFDIKEFLTNDGVKRFRCWDSCMYSEFTKVAHGNPRTNQMQRFRQRFMHKLVYYPNNNEGIYSCVGCGRCVRKCPQHLNIVKVIKEFGGDNE